MALEPRVSRRISHDSGVIDLTKDSDSDESVQERAEDPMNAFQNRFDEYFDQEEEEEIEWHRVPIHLRPTDLPVVGVADQGVLRPGRTLSNRSSSPSSASSSSSPSPSSSSGIPVPLGNGLPLPFTGNRPRTQRTHRAFVAEIIPALNEIYDGGPNQSRRSVMEELEQDNILPAYHLNEADLILSMTWARFAHEYGHIGSTNQFRYLMEYLSNYGLILLKVNNGFNSFKHFLIMLSHNRKLEDPSRPDIPGLKIAFSVGKLWKRMRERLNAMTPDDDILTNSYV